MKYNPEQIQRATNIINENSISVRLKGKTIEVAPITCRTIMEACKYISLLPKIEEDSENATAKLVSAAFRYDPLFYAAAILIYGAKKCYARQYFYGAKKIEIFARKLKNECSPSEIREAVMRLLSSQVCTDFFAMVSAVSQVMLIETT